MSSINYQRMCFILLWQCDTCRAGEMCECNTTKLWFYLTRNFICRQGWQLSPPNCLSKGSTSGTCHSSAPLKTLPFVLEKVVKRAKYTRSDITEWVGAISHTSLKLPVCHILLIGSPRDVWSNPLPQQILTNTVVSTTSEKGHIPHCLPTKWSLRTSWKIRSLIT